jgi:hypothetical protein
MEEATVAENPSADRFGPPPEQARREREQESLMTGAKAGGTLGTTALFLGIVALKFVSHSHRGWVATLAGILVIAGYGAQFVLARRQRERDGGPEPFSKPTHLTR